MSLLRLLSHNRSWALLTLWVLFRETLYPPELSFEIFAKAAITCLSTELVWISLCPVTATKHSI